VIINAHCVQAYPIIKQVQKHLGNKSHFVFRNFPITQIHPHAKHAAEAAKSAAAQNKFWEIQITYTNINKHLRIII
jgi:protein-disulfide isomerase